MAQLGRSASGGRSGRLFVFVFAGLLALWLGVVNLPTSESEAATSFAFTAAGDWGQTSWGTTPSLDYLRTSGAAFNLALGDLSYGLAESTWCDYVKAHVGSTFPFELLSGNHEDDGQPVHIDRFVSCLPDRLGGLVGTYGKEYYFDYLGLARFILISPNLQIDRQRYDYVPGSPHYTFLSDAIDGARAKGLPWVIVGLHELCLTTDRMWSPCYSGGESWLQLVAQKRVDLVLQGHSHSYERSRQLGTSAACPKIALGSFNSACVVDDGIDGIYRKGAGTVFVTVGTGGQSLAPFNSGDPEVPYFAQWMFSDVTPRMGVLRVTVSSSTMTAEFVPTGLYCKFGCVSTSFSDRFTFAAPGAEPIPVPHTLTVNTTGTAGGKVVSAPPGISCPADCTETYAGDTVVELTAISDANTGLNAWSGGWCTKTLSCRLTMDADKSVTASFSPRADLRLTMTDAPDPVAVGASLTYTLSATNGGPASTPGARVVDTLPNGVRVDAVTPSQGTCTRSATSPVTVTCNVGTLASGAQATIQLKTTPSAAGTLTNTATIRSSQISDPNAANNQATTMTVVR